MAVFFKGDIAKGAPSITNEQLRRLLDQKEPRVIRFISRMWKRQQGDITYQEIRQALLTGEIDAATIERWHQDYSRLVTEDLMPEWQYMMREAGKAFEQRWPAFTFDPSTQAIAEYTARHAAEFVTNSTAQQVEAIRAVVRRASSVQDLSVDQLARAIRPTIGLYKGQAVANFNYFNTVRETLLANNPTMRAATATKRAREAAIRYAERQHRYRAHMIARTELSFAHNTGEYYAVRQAQAEGYIEQCVKEWVTAHDGRVCDLCKAMDRTRVPIDSPFPNADLTPPLHPHCRCVVNYIEI